MLEITSSHNPKFKTARLLLDARGKKKWAVFDFWRKSDSRLPKVAKPVEAILYQKAPHTLIYFLKT